MAFVGRRTVSRRIKSGGKRRSRAREAANRDGVGETRRSEALLELESRFAACLTLLGGDDDDAVRSARSVDRARRGSFQDLNALDVVRVDVRGAIDVLVLTRREVQQVSGSAGVRNGIQSALNRCVVDDDAVDHVERLVAGVDRRDPTKLDLGSTARRAGILSDERSRNFAGKSLIERLCRNSIESLG